MNGNFSGADCFTFEMTDNGDPTYCTTGFCSIVLDFYNATVTITINVFYDAPAITVDATEQTVQYRDEIIPVTIDASDIDSSEISISLKGAPEDSTPW